MFKFKNKRLTLALIKHKFRAYRAILAMVLLMAMLGIMTMPLTNINTAKSEAAGTPRFNFLTGDYEMLQVAHEGSADWVDPISANVGDKIAYSFYYHNGMLNTIAHNTSLRVDLPLAEGTALTATSWLWSDETAPISDTVVNGQTVGLSGATINTSGSARIEYIPGSTNWYPNGSSTATPLTDGITSGGVNIGNIQGCWNYAGFVTFMVEVKGPAQLVMDKKVGHPGATVDWAKYISANPGDSVAYHLGIRNDGGTTATGVTLKDVLPSYMTYSTGTTYLYTRDHPEGILQADTLFSTGIGIPDIAPGQENVVYLTYRTRIDSNMPSGAFTLNNVARVFMGGVEQDQDQAQVYVTCERGIVLDKKVSNGVSWVEENTAHMGDSVSYRIIIRNTGNVPLLNTSIRDALPQFVTYTFGSTKVDGVSVGDSIVASGGLVLGTINPGCEKVITLSGVINGCAPLGESTLTNTAYGDGDGAVEKLASARTVLTVFAPVMPR